MTKNKTYEETRELLDFLIKNTELGSSFVMNAQYQINKMYAEMSKALEDSMIYETGLMKLDKESDDSGNDSK